MLALFTAFGRDQTFNEETVTAMRGFYSPLDWDEAWQWKLSHLCGSLAFFIGQVSKHIDPYWSCLKEPFTDLWEDVFDGITLYPTNEEDLGLFKPKSQGREQLSDNRKQRFDDRNRRLSGDRRQRSGGRNLSEGASGCLKNDLPITHDIFLHCLNEMLWIAKSEDETEEEEKRALQLDAEQARLRAEQTKLDLEVARELALLARRDLRSKTQKLNSIGQPRDALPTESSSTSTGLGNTADSLDSSATIQAQPSPQPWNPFTAIRGESLILEKYDEREPKAPERVNNYFTPLSCIGVSQMAQFHIPSSDLPSANHAPLITRAFPFSAISKRAHPDGNGDLESANPRVSKRQKSMKSGKTKTVSSNRGSRKERRGLRASSALLCQLNFEEN
jgi:hypothetical protein